MTTPETLPLGRSQTYHGDGYEFQVRAERHPLKAGAVCYRVYDCLGTPLYIGRESLAEAVAMGHEHMRKL